jgi:thiol-disulfide isomerase/thioredoxin
VAVTRISNESLDMLLQGKVKEAATCVLKFYSNGCPMCHALSDYYAEISQEDKYKDLHFFAVNIDDYPEIERRLNFKGVPTIFILHSNIGNRAPTIRVIEEPEKPNDKTWYKVSDIKKFIDREAL